MSFRQYGGINYAARNNIVKNNFTNASNLSIMNKVGQPDSKINVESTLDVYAINLTSPTITTNQNGVVPKSYVDLVGGGLKPKAACQCATTVALSGSDNPMIGTYSSLTLDGYTVLTGDRVLIKNQEDTSTTYLGSVYNGIYVYTIVSGLGTFARSSDYAIGDDAYGAYLLISNGVVNGNKNFIEINEGLVGTSVLLFTPFTASFAVGQGLEKVPLGSSTEVRVKNDLSNPPFITSLAVSGLTTMGTLNVSGLVTFTGNLNATGTNTINGYATTASLGLYAPLASPALTGIPTAPTATAGTGSTQIATTAFVQNAVSTPSASFTITSNSVGTNSWGFTISNTLGRAFTYSLYTDTVPTTSGKSNLVSSGTITYGGIILNGSFIFSTGSMVYQPYSGTSSAMITYCSGNSETYYISASGGAYIPSVINNMGSVITWVVSSNSVSQNSACPPAASSGFTTVYTVTSSSSVASCYLKLVGTVVAS